MKVRSLIRQRLGELGLEQRDLASAANVTESYVSQLLTRDRLPPAPERTDIYARMEKALRLRRGSLSELAEMERRHELQKQISGPPLPLLRELRELVLKKCALASEPEIRAIFEREPLGALERLVTQMLLDVAKRTVRENLDDEKWLRLVARLSKRSFEELRVIGLEFLDTDLLNVSVGDCLAFLNPLLESWEIDLSKFDMNIALNPRLVPMHTRRCEFVERDGETSPEASAGFKEFLKDPTLSGDANPEEVAFLERLRFEARLPTALYYYRALQSLRDPLHFRSPDPSVRRSLRKIAGGR